MDNVACSGTESTLTSCSHITSHNCGHGEDAGVQCETCKSFSAGMVVQILFQNNYLYN